MRVLICLVCLVHVLSMSAQSAGWEYVLSEEAFDGAELNAAVEIGDKVVIGGGAARCMQPTIWVFDKAGKLEDTFHLLDSMQEVREELFTYGRITAMRYDSLSGYLDATGTIAYADDVGGRLAVIFRFNRDLKLITIFDFRQFGPFHDQNIIIADSLFVVRDQDASYLLDADLNLVSQGRPNGFSMQDALYSNGQFVKLVGENLVVVYSFSGMKLASISIPLAESMILVDDVIIIEGKDGVLYAYLLETLQELDQLKFSDFEDLQLHRVSGNLFQIVTYYEHRAPSISLYSRSFEFQGSVLGDLLGESKLRLFLGDTSLYILGRHYSNDTPFGQFQEGVMAFVREVDLVDTTVLERPDFEIKSVKILNSVEADLCRIGMDGTEQCLLDGDPIHYEMTVHNTGTDTIYNFGYYTTILGGHNCGLGNFYRYANQHPIPPGTEMLVQDYLVPEGPSVPDSISFYIVAPNHRLHEGDNSLRALLDISLAAHHASLNEMHVYPNPAQSVIFLHTEEHKPIGYEIYTFDGVKVDAGDMSSGQIDVSRFLPGSYLLRLYVGKYLRHHRFVKSG